MQDQQAPPPPPQRNSNTPARTLQPVPQQSVPPLPIGSYANTVIRNPQAVEVAANPFRLPDHIRNQPIRTFTPSNRTQARAQSPPNANRTMWQISKDLQQDLDSAVNSLRQYSPQSQFVPLAYSSSTNLDPSPASALSPTQNKSPRVKAESLASKNY